MPMKVIRGFCLGLLWCALVGGCGSKHDSAETTHSQQPEPPETAPHVMELGPLTQLAPALPTHLAADSQGNVYWVQETPDGHDAVFVSAANDIPQQTSLTSDAIIAAFGPAPPPKAAPVGASSEPSSPGIGGGNIQSIAIDADDHLLFFFSGGVGRSAYVCLGQFNPRDQSLRILADTQTLASASRMGASIQLARGQIIKPISVAPGQPMRFWLWLHHSDAAAMFCFDPHRVERGQQIELTLQFDRLSGNGAPDNLAADGLDFSAGTTGTLLLVDRHIAKLWHVDENGLATKWMTLVGLPADLSQFTARDSGIALAFAPLGEPAFGTDNDDQMVKEAHYLKVQFPAVLAFWGDDVFPTVTREDISAAREVDIAKLKLQQLVPTSASHQWTAYDTASGLLLRVRLEPRN
jgi:hypothetical protein